MSNAVKQFEFPFLANSVRVVTDEKGNPWFCAKDVCDILGYSNSRKAISDHCRKDGVTIRYTVDNLGRKNEATFIDEGNIYRLTIKSNKPEAEPFESLVCDVILPTIRKTGEYSTRGSKPKIAPTPQEIFMKNHKFASIIHTGREQRLECANAETLAQTGINILADHEVKLGKNNPALKNLLAREINGRAVKELLDSAHYCQQDCLESRRLLLNNYLKLIDGRLHIGNKCPLVADQKALQSLKGALVNVSVWFRKNCKSTVIQLYETGHHNSSAKSDPRIEL